MFPGEGGAEPPNTRAAVTSDVLRTPRRMRVLFGVVLAASLWWLPAATFAGERVIPADEHDDTLVFGLTATQLALAAAVGAGAGAAGALASGNVIAGASLGFGTLAAIYVAHLAAEAVVVGGIYYWWPWEAEPESPASRTMTIRGAGEADARSPALR
jgi:hypothetical protein